MTLRHQTKDKKDAEVNVCCRTSVPASLGDKVVATIADKLSQRPSVLFSV